MSRSAKVFQNVLQWNNLIMTWSEPDIVDTPDAEWDCVEDLGDTWEVAGCDGVMGLPVAECTKYIVLDNEGNAVFLNGNVESEES